MTLRHKIRRRVFVGEVAAVVVVEVVEAEDSVAPPLLEMRASSQWARDQDLFSLLLGEQEDVASVDVASADVALCRADQPFPQICNTSNNDNFSSLNFFVGEVVDLHAVAALLHQWVASPERHRNLFQHTAPKLATLASFSPKLLCAIVFLQLLEILICRLLQPLAECAADEVVVAFEVVEVSEGAVSKKSLFSPRRSSCTTHSSSARTYFFFPDTYLMIFFCSPFPSWTMALKFRRERS